MTLSIAARCPKTQRYGVVAITQMIGIGKLITHAAGGVGAVATQGEMNPYHGIRGLQRMAKGHDARDALEPLIEADRGRQKRQCGAVDRAGSSWAWTGDDLPEWRGQRLGDGFAVQGNRLVGPGPVEAVAEEFERGSGANLDERLLRAIEAGHDAGADRAGERSATLYVMGEEEYPLWDIRIDEAEDPIAELRRMHDVFVREVLPIIVDLPGRAALEPGSTMPSAGRVG